MDLAIENKLLLFIKEEQLTEKKLKRIFSKSPKGELALDIVINGGLISDIDASLNILRTTGEEVGLPSYITQDNENLYFFLKNAR